MGAALFILFLVAATILITALVFGGWLVVSIIRLIVNAISAIAGVQPRPMPARDPRMLGNPAGATHAPPRMLACVNPSCRNVNPMAASFCRRCGHRLPQPQRVAVRRAAMW
jgi:hypothetical protein